jgi:anaerobic selenocysteine-containing dehydrogenase/Fe-S-cluster-containing dehydrogenase component
VEPVIERRDFLKTLGLAGSAAVLDSCAQQPTEPLIPYFVAPDAVVAGERAYYATTCRGCPAGCGLIATTVNGRITKAEGNPEHPIGQGRLCARGQGVVQAVYNPYRFRQPLLRDVRGTLQPLSWGDGEQLLATRLREARLRGANRIAWIGRLETGPFEELVTTWLGALESNRRLVFETFDYHAIRAATSLAFGRAEIPRYDLERADFVLAFGAEFLETWISNVEFTRAYARLRAKRAHDADGSFVWIAPRLSLTGLNADAWLPVAPGSEATIACGIANALLREARAPQAAARMPARVREALDPFAPDRVAAATGVPADAIREIARRCAAASSPIALGGSTAGSAVALETAVLVLNALAGAIGSTVTFGSGYALDRISTRDDVARLIAAMRQGEIDVLLTHHANPVYGLPPAEGFGDAISRVPFVVSFDTLQDETTDHAHLVMPDHHDLESWGAYAARDGVAGLLQPAAAPLFDTRATGDVLVEVAQQTDATIARVVGATPWRDRVERSWNGSWNDVAHAGGRFAANPPAPAADLGDVSGELATISVGNSNAGLTVIACPTTHVFDGRHADVSWLQELPDPVTKTVWANCAEVHPETAARLGIAEGDEIELASPHGRITARAHLYAGLHPNAIAIAIGYGRTASMRTGSAARGSNPIALLPGAQTGAVSVVSGVTVRRAAGGRRLTVLQAQPTARPDTRPADAKIVGPDRVDAHDPETPKTVQFYAPHEHPQHRWGMAIDLNACTGCSACVVACYAENNIAVVGPQFCEQGREMSWIRIERDVHEVDGGSGLRAPGNVFLPMLCQQCDNAPCEAVCPVYATYHNPEGLNAQIYPRCIGTRFCSNNCPYKVRRFNWARYGWEAPLTEQLNPNVTVRSVGVMEKCTFCVQRIAAGKLAAKREQRAVGDGDIVPACAQTCPADAIVFGDLHDPNSRVSRLTGVARGYHVLDDLNTKPAITYLRRVVPGAPDHGD